MRKLTPRAVACVAVTLVALGAAGCGTDTPAGVPPVSAATDTATGQQGTAGATTGGGAIGSPSPGAQTTDSGVAAVLAALDTAARAVPNGSPYDVESETRDNQQVWEIKVASNGEEHTVYVSADGANVVEQRKHDSPDDDVAKVGQATVNASTALQTAAAAQGGVFDEMEIDTHQGTLVWEVEFQNGATGTTVYVDARTGAIIE